MSRRRRAPVGEWLVRDDESGLVYPSGEVVSRWDGAVVHRTQDEERNPQEFVRGGDDPQPVRPTRPRPVGEYQLIQFFTLDGINYRVASQFAKGIAASAADPDGMKVGFSFQVAPDTLSPYPYR